MALDPPARRNLISLFTGCGGLDLGLEQAGFTPTACVELDPDSRRSIAANTAWPLLEGGDIRSLPPRDAAAALGVRPGEVDLVAGGPPCQPFSKAGQWVNGSAPGFEHRDGDTLQAFMDVLGSCLPRAMLLENVRGLAAARRQNRETPVELIERNLAQINRLNGTSYVLQLIKLDAADYGVPQHRIRVFAFASREGELLEIPPPSHGPLSTSGARYVAAWDAIGDLDDAVDPALAPTGKWAALLPSIPEGQNYQFHTPRGDGEPLFGYRTKYWSFLLKLAKDRPSWTLSAQPGPATGPFHWRNRRLSLREMARLQTFPDDHHVVGSYHSAQRQIGNAVPAAMGELLGRTISRSVWRDEIAPLPTCVVSPAASYPQPEPPEPIPAEFLSLRGPQPDHPGHGLGPRAILRTTA